MITADSAGVRIVKDASSKQRGNRPLVAKVCMLVPIVVTSVTAPEAAGITLRLPVSKVKARDPKARRQASLKSDGCPVPITLQQRLWVKQATSNPSNFVSSLNVPQAPYMWMPRSWLRSY